MTTQVLSLPWISTHRRRVSGAAGIPTLSPPLQAGEVVVNEVDTGGLIEYYGVGNDGNGNATSFAVIGGPGAFVDKVSAQTIGGAKTFSLAAIFQAGLSSVAAIAAPLASIIAASFPKVLLNALNNGVDAKQWQSYVGTDGSYHLDALNDANTASNPAFSVSRVGAVPGVMSLYAGLAVGGVPNVPYTFAGSAANTRNLWSVSASSENGPEFCASFQLVASGGSTNQYGNYKSTITGVLQANAGAPDTWCSDLSAASSASLASGTGLITQELDWNDNHWECTSLASAGPHYATPFYISGAASTKVGHAAQIIGGSTPFAYAGQWYEDRTAATIVNLPTTSAQGAAGATLPMSSTSGIVAGMLAYAPGVPLRDRVLSVAANASVTLSVSTTAALASGVSVRFYYSTITFATIYDSSRSATCIYSATTHVNGVDWSNATFLAYAFQSPGFSIDKTGNVAAASVAVSAGGTATLPVATPSSSSAPGVPGQFSSDASYLYICTGANTWKRVALATF